MSASDHETSLPLTPASQPSVGDRAASGHLAEVDWLAATLAEAYMDSLSSDVSPDFDAGITFAAARVADALQGRYAQFDRERFFRKAGMADPRLLWQRAYVEGEDKTGQHRA